MPKEKPELSDAMRAKISKKTPVKNEISYGKFERKVLLPIIINDQDNIKTTIQLSLIHI